MKGRKIKNLTREDITIVDYKKLLVKNSTSAVHYASSSLPPRLLFSSVPRARACSRFGSSRFMCRLRGAREGEAVQQDDEQDQGRVDPLRFPAL